MALGLVLVGIATGFLAAGTVLVLGGGIGFAVLAYTGGGLVGMLGGLAGALSPQNRGSAIVSQDHN